MNASSPAHHVAAVGESPSRGAETHIIVFACLIAALALAATAISPAIDIWIARLFLLPQDSLVQPVLTTVREIGRAAPYLLFVGTLALLGVQAARGHVSPAAAWRRAAFVTAVLAVGPGLIVNAGLKAHSHRPRPLQTFEAAGADQPFRPYFQFDGLCEKNCSFSSGEAASAFWTAAPAMLAPPPVRLVATVAALAFGSIVSALRMITGAHFLSDVAFSALIVLLLTLATRRMLACA